MPRSRPPAAPPPPATPPAPTPALTPAPPTRPPAQPQRTGPRRTTDQRSRAGLLDAAPPPLPRGHIAFQVELMMPLAPRSEEAVAFRIDLGEAAREGVVDLIALASDRRADRRRDPFPVRAQLFHRPHHGLDHPAESAFPAGMGGADDARFGVGEQDRRAVCREDAEREADPVGDERVGMRTGVVGPWRGRDDHVGR